MSEQDLGLYYSNPTKLQLIWTHIPASIPAKNGVVQQRKSVRPRIDLVDLDCVTLRPVEETVGFGAETWMHATPALPEI